ncbi:MAG: hypothetical protein LBS57_12600, partial [Treponema sp.]|nr:hypothetical protein [Treponema sp.]
MSDIFEQTDADWLRRINASNQAGLEAALKHNETERFIRDQRIPGVTNEEFTALYQQVQNGLLTTDELSTLMSALSIAKDTGVALDTVLKDQDFFLSQYGIDAQEVKPSSWFDATLDALWRGRINTQMGQLWGDVRKANDSGNPETAKYYLQEIEKLKQEQQRFTDPWAKERNLLVRGLGHVAESGPYMAYITAAGIAAGGVGSFAMGWELNRNNEYGALINAGVKHDIADRTSNWVGALQSVVEIGLGRGAGKILTKLGGVNVASVVTDKVVNAVTKRLHLSGIPYQLAKFGLSALWEAVGEGGEEVIQAVIGYRGLLNAKGIQYRDLEKALADPTSAESKALLSKAQDVILEDEINKLSKQAALEVKAELLDLGVKAEDLEDFMKTLPEEFMGGFLSALVLQAGDALFAIPGGFAQAKAIADEARINPSKEDFVKKMEGSGIPRQVLENTHDKVRQQRDREEARIAAELKAQGSQLAGLEERKVNDAGEDVTPQLYRNPDGSFYTRIEGEKREGGVVTGSYRGGDGSRRTESNSYWNIDYRIENGALDITAVNIAGHRKAEFDEFFRQFAKQFADMDIRWNPETEADIALKEQLIAANRRGQNAGLNYFESAETAVDESYRIRLDKQIQEHTRLNADEREAWIQLWEAAGEKNGLGLQGTFEQVFADPESIFSETLENAQAAQAKGAVIKGATFWKETEKGLRAVMYVAKNGDFSTLSHESIHAYRAALKGIDSGLSAEIDRVLDRNVKRAPGMSEGDYRRAQEEYLAENFEDYLYNGIAPEPALKSLFDQIAAFMRRIYSHLAGKQEISPEIQKVFDQIFSGYDSRTESAKATQNGPEGTETYSDTENAAGRVPGASTTLSGASETGVKEYPGLGGRVDSGPVQAEGYDDIDAWVQTLPPEQQENYRRNKALNENRESLGKNDRKEDPKPVIEGVGADDLESLKKKAAEGHNFIRDLAHKWAERWDDKELGRPGFENRAVLKSDARAIEKHEEEDTPYNQMLDMVGFTVVVDDMATLLKMAKEVISEGAVVRAKDRYTDGGVAGYRDFLLNVRTKDGFVGEIQLNVRQMFEAKEAFGGHALYEVRRSLSTEVKNGAIDPAVELKDNEILGEISEKFYGKAYGLALAESEANATSLDMSSPSFSAYTSKNGEADNVLSSFTANNLDRLLAQGWSRHQINRNDGSSIDGISDAAGLGEDLTNRNSGILEAGASSSAKSAT